MKVKISSATVALGLLVAAALAGAAPANAADNRNQCEQGKPCFFITADFASAPWAISPWPTQPDISLDAHPLNNQVSSINMRTGRSMTIWDSWNGTGPSATVAGWNALGNLAYVGWNDRISSLKTI